MNFYFKCFWLKHFSLEVRKCPSRCLCEGDGRIFWYRGLWISQYSVFLHNMFIETLGGIILLELLGDTECAQGKVFFTCRTELPKRWGCINLNIKNPSYFVARLEYSWAKTCYIEKSKSKGTSQKNMGFGRKLSLAKREIPSGGRGGSSPPPENFEVFFSYFSVFRFDFVLQN